MSKPHCWFQGPEEKDGMTTTCMLEDGHPGEHEFTRDCDITFQFGAAPKPEANGRMR